VRISGRVLDGEGAPVPDALVETWDPDARAFARCPTDDAGYWTVVTPLPHRLAVNVFARGLLHHVVTHIYLDARSVPDAVPEHRRHTLIAEPEGDGYRFDIRLQGPDETVFFAA
jgi:protocatechuate 3,4-dioxygenase alpha subunit